jgi:hypothetical protein
VLVDHGLGKRFGVLAAVAGDVADGTGDADRDLGDAARVAVRHEEPRPPVGTAAGGEHGNLVDFDDVAGVLSHGDLLAVGQHRGRVIRGQRFPHRSARLVAGLVCGAPGPVGNVEDGQSNPAPAGRVGDQQPGRELAVTGRVVQVMLAAWAVQSGGDRGAPLVVLLVPPTVHSATSIQLTTCS